MSSGLFKNNVTNNYTLKDLINLIQYIYKEDLALTNLQGLICHKT